uniref:Uncharacterized protein n=1 Tax=Parascaris equorum TaxID=6256 RepID=A0A914SA39_PAREQ
MASTLDMPATVKTPKVKPTSGTKIQKFKEAHPNLTLKKGSTQYHKVDIPKVGHVDEVAEGVNKTTVIKSGEHFDEVGQLKNGLNTAETSKYSSIISKYDDIDVYEFDGIRNPGPLSELESVPNRNFYGGRYNVTKLDKDIVLYRAGSSDNPMGQWFTTKPPVSRAQVRIDTAVKDIWTNRKGAYTGQSPIDKVYELKIPKGTTIYEGPVASQGGIYQGGLDKMQIFIDRPWDIDGVEVLNSWNIKS